MNKGFDLPLLLMSFVLPVCLWVMIMALVSIAGGWSTLATRFRTDRAFPDTSWSWQSAYVRYRMHYGSCLVVGSNHEGLFLRTFWIASFRHPPLFIPWSEISLTTSQSWILGEVGRFTLGREAQIPFTVGTTLLKRIQQTAGDLQPVTTF
jgi:hypothetical protein